MGSDTFIIVAFMWRENKAPSDLTRSISSPKKASSFRMDNAAQSIISPAWRAKPLFKSVRLPSWST